MTMPGELPEECQAVAADLPELALGVLPGRERSVVLSHLDSCLRCRGELARLSQAADSVLRATPRLEPPAGFDERVLAKMMRRGDPRAAPAERLGADRRPSAQRRHKTQRRQRRLVSSLAAAVVALAVPLGLVLSEGANAPVSSSATGTHASAALVSDGRVLGHVSTYYGHNRRTSWLSMTLQGAGGTGVVKCQVTVRDGSPVTVGTFWLDDGTGHWNSALPMPADEVTGARVLAANSTVVATAHFT